MRASQNLPLRTGPGLDFPAPPTRGACARALALAAALTAASPAGFGQVISEVMASNTGGLTDGDGDTSDWIEIHNPTGSPADLTGWFLTDDEGDLTKWRIPSLTLEAGGYAIVFASSKGDDGPAGELHTNFRLSAGGEYLALVMSDASTVATATTFPEQFGGVAWGTLEVAGPFDFLTRPTPESRNLGPPGLPTEGVIFSQAGGLVPSGYQLVLAPAVPGNSIRYTTNGSNPTILSGSIYDGPITISRTTEVRAQLLGGGPLEGGIIAHTFVPYGQDVADFSSDIPVAVVDSFGQNVNGQGSDSNHPFIDAFAVFVDVDPAGGRATLTGTPNFQGPGGMKVRGQTSSNFPKKQYSFETRDAAGEDLEVSILGFPSESDWVLHAPYSDKSLMRNYLVYNWAREIGQYGSRTRFFELFYNYGSTVTMSDYVGVYILMEKIKRDPARVDIADLHSGITGGAEITGGYVFKKDKGSGDVTFSTPRVGNLAFVEPENPNNQQRNYLRTHVNEFENVLHGGNFTDPVDGYAKYIDVDSFIETHILVELAKNIDGFRLSSYYTKDRGGKIHAGPVWDYNLSLGNADYLGGENPRGWYYPQISSQQYPWYGRLFDDPAFELRYWDRYYQLRRSVFDEGKLLAQIDGIAEHLGEAQVRNFQKWSDLLGRYVWPNATGNHVWPGTNVATRNTYQLEIDWMKDWLSQRLEWYDDQFVEPPEFVPAGGAVEEGTDLIINSDEVTFLRPDNVIYYTLDGTDPRAEDGSINPNAIAYSRFSPPPLEASATIAARVRLGTTGWSAFSIVHFVVGAVPAAADNLAISEIMYNPLPPAEGAETEASGGNRDAFEFIELVNFSDREVDLAGAAFTQGIAFDFDTGSAVRSLAPGGHLLLVRNRAAFEARYGTGLPVAGEFLGDTRLSNKGETLTLVGASGQPLIAFSYGDDAPWPETSDGTGFSLVALAPGPGSAPGNPSSWRASSAPGGSPGSTDPAPDIPRILINEALTNSAPPAVDKIELFNPGGEAVDLGGWFLSDSAGEPRKFRIPDDTVVEPGAYLVILEDNDADPDNNDDLPEEFFGRAFALSSAGDAIHLFSADAAGTLTGYHHGFTFGAAAEGVTLGRHVDSTGREHFTAQAAASLGAANGAPAIGPVVMTEIAYHPATVPPADEDEFLELQNTSGAAVALHLEGDPATAWRVRGINGADGEHYTFPAGSSLLAGQVALIVARDPETFRTDRGVPADVAVFGPFAGGLANNGERLTLERPAPDGTGGVLYLTVDALTYDDEGDWPAEADGAGPTLERRSPPGTTFADDPGSWTLSQTAGGTPGTIPAAPGGLAVWAAGFFTVAELADPDISGPRADPDGDGVPNLLEYAFGSDPADRASRLPPGALFSPGGQPGSPGHLSLTFRRRQNAPDLQFTVEVSDDLSAWDDAETTEIEASDNGDGTETVTVRDDRSAGGQQRRFIRLRVGTGN